MEDFLADGQISCISLPLGALSSSVWPGTASSGMDHLSGLLSPYPSEQLVCKMVVSEPGLPESTCRHLPPTPDLDLCCDLLDEVP